MVKVQIWRNLPVTNRVFSSSRKNKWLELETFRTDFNVSSDVICVYF